MNRWIIGSRPRTLPAAVVPVAMGAVVAVGEGGAVWLRVVAAAVVVVEIVGVWLAPLLCLAAGLALWWRRRA